MPEKDKLTPITILTGFLGSGKTTLLNALLSSPDFSDTAVLINEFGEIGLDHLLVDTINEEVVLLESGCVCCSVRDDLTNALIMLHREREEKRIPFFSRVVLETTGIADPTSIHQLIVSDSEVLQRYYYRDLITVVDAVYGYETLTHHFESVKQVSIADQLIISKTDLVEQHNADQLEAHLKILNKSARILHTGKQSVSPKGIFRHGEMISKQEIDHLKLRSDAFPSDAPSETMQSSQHSERFSSFYLKWKEPVAWEDFTAWLEGLLIVRGDNILRLKGLLSIKGNNLPVFIQGVQHSFYPPRELTKWPDLIRETALIFITYDFNKKAAIKSLENILTVDAY